MRLIVISGLSGAGKSVALHTFEDLGYYCTDNLPANLLPAFTEQLVQSSGEFYEHAAVGIDARNPARVLKRFPELVQGLVTKGVDTEVVYLEAADDILITRFSETRRRHPLTTGGVSLAEAIHKERDLLETFANAAALRIDTSRTTLHQLRDMIRTRVGERSRGLSLLFLSFGFKQGVPRDADFVFDLRCLPNPYWIPALRPLTGRDAAVAEYLDHEALVEDMYADIKGLLAHWLGRFEAENRAYLTVALGCTGGQHRSVYLAERLATELGAERRGVLVRHRELT